MNQENKQSQAVSETGNPVPEPVQPQRIRNKYAEKIGKKKHKLPKWVKRTILGVVLVGMVAGAVKIVQTANRAADTVDAANQTTFASYQPLETYVEGTGSTAAKNTEQYGKDLKGEVLTVDVAVGDTVHTGDILFTVDPKESREELDDATSELNDAQRAVDDAQADLQKAQKNLGNLTVTVPFTGKMLAETDGNGKETTYKVGQSIAEGTVLGTMVDDSVMRLPLYFNEVYLDQIQVGAAANVSIPVSMSTVTGKVESIERVQKISDDGVKLFRVNITMTNPGTLKGGMLATASISSSAGDILPTDAGSLEYNREEAVTVKGSGEITSIGGLDNYTYSAGAVICRLKNDEYQTAIDTAQRAVESAQKTVATKQQRITELQKTIAQSTVTATMDGIVTDISVVVGQKIEGSSDVCTIADLTSIVVNADISELDVDKVSAGMDTIITMDQDESLQYNGTVTSVGMQAKNASNDGGQNSNRVFPAVITLQPEDAAKLSPDRSVSYKIITAQNDNCLVVPSTAIVYTETGAAVYARQEEGMEFENAQPIPEGSDVPEGFVLVPITTGIFDDDNTEVVSGITEGTEVFLAAPQDADAFMGSIDSLEMTEMR